MGCQIIIDHLESLLSIIIIRIDNGKRAVHNRQTGQNRMSRSPGLHPSLRHCKALRQSGDILEYIFHLDPLCHPVADGLSEILLVLFLDDKNDFLKSSLHRIIDRKIHNDMSVLIYRIDLFQSAVTTPHSCRHDNKYRFLHTHLLLLFMIFMFVQVLRCLH